MLDLLKNYSLSDIAIFIVILALAIKGVVDFYDWAKNRIRKPIDKENVEKEKEQEIMAKLVAHEEQILSCKECLENINKNMNILIASDKDDIKAWITEKHHYFCYDLGYIDDYNLQCIEARYKHYKEEDGNTFIDGFMTDIRALPIVSVIHKKEENK